MNIYFEGLTILKKGMNWKSGKLSKNDILLSLDRSKVEIMLSRIVCATYLYQDYNICKQYGEQLLESIKIRGMNDLFSKELPKGVKFMVNESINPPKSTGLEKKIEDYWKGLDKPPF